MPTTTFTAAGRFPHSVVSVARQSSTGGGGVVIAAGFQKGVLQWPLANQQTLFYMKKLAFENSISQQVFLTGKFQILYVDTLDLEVVAGSSSP